MVWPHARNPEDCLVRRLYDSCNHGERVSRRSTTRRRDDVWDLAWLFLGLEPAELSLRDSSWWLNSSQMFQWQIVFWKILHFLPTSSQIDENKKNIFLRTFREERRGFPKDMKSTKDMKKCEMDSRYFDGTSIVKWLNTKISGDIVAVGKPERQVRKASHCGSKQKHKTPDEITLLSLVRTTHLWVLFFTHIPIVANCTFNATPSERLQQYQQLIIDILKTKHTMSRDARKAMKERWMKRFLQWFKGRTNTSTKLIFKIRRQRCTLLTGWALETLFQSFLELHWHGWDWRARSEVFKKIALKFPGGSK